MQVSYDAEVHNEETPTKIKLEQTPHKKFNLNISHGLQV